MKNLSKMRWDETETHTFVKLYLSHSCLWNPEHEDYKQKFKRKEAYIQISKDFNESTNITLTEPEVRYKIKNLRSTYNLELAKIKQHGYSKLTWFDDFNKCILNITKTLKNEAVNESENPQESQKLWVGTDVDIDNEPLDVNFESDTKDPMTSEDNYVFLLKTEPGETQADTTSTTKKRQKPFKSKKRKIKHRSPSPDTSDQTFRGSLDSNSDPREDEFDIYGKYIASQLREMGIQRALRVQLHIQNIVSEARLEAVRENL